MEDLDNNAIYATTFYSSIAAQHSDIWQVIADV